MFLLITEKWVWAALPAFGIEVLIVSAFISEREHFFLNGISSGLLRYH